MVGEITHQQQARLFEIVYARYVSLAKGYYLKYTKQVMIIPDAISWESMDKKIKDVYIDIVYQGVDNIKLLTTAAAGNSSKEMVALIEKSSLYMKYEKERKRICHLL